MLTKKKLLCFLVSLSLLFSIFTNGFVTLAVLHDYDEDASQSRYTYNGSLTIEGVTYAEPATDSQLASSITEIILLDQDDITVDSTHYATLTVDGVERDIAAGSFTGTTIVITVSEKAQAMTGNGPLLGGATITYYTRAAAVIAGNTLQTAYAVPDALIGGTTDANTSSDVTIDSKGSYFSQCH